MRVAFVGCIESFHTNQQSAHNLFYLESCVRRKQGVWSLNGKQANLLAIKFLDQNEVQYI